MRTATICLLFPRKGLPARLQSRTQPPPLSIKSTRKLVATWFTIHRYLGRARQCAPKHSQPETERFPESAAFGSSPSELVPALPRSRAHLAAPERSPESAACCS